MRILYGVVGVGMGHVTRSRVVIDHLLAQGHALVVVASGTAPEVLEAQYADEPRVRVERVAGYGMVFDDHRVDVGATLVDLFDGAPARLAFNAAVWTRRLGAFQPDVVISDFEAFAHWYGRFFGIPVISIDNLQVLNRCALYGAVVDTRSLEFQIAKATVKGKLPGAYHYLVSSFFDPPVRKDRTSVVGPILRPEILAARRERGDHLLVYQSVWSESLLDALRSLSTPIIAYGADREGTVGNLTFRAFSESGFVEDLRTARAVVAGGGFSLMCEAIHLGVPLLAIPLAGHVEQDLNARYLAHLGYGDRAPQLTAEVLCGFLAREDDFAAALASYRRRDNRPLLRAVDDLLDRAMAA